VKEKEVDSNSHTIKNYFKQDDVTCLEKNMMVTKKTLNFKNYFSKSHEFGKLVKIYQIYWGL